MEDQWDVQLQTQVYQSCSFHIYSDGLTYEEIRMAYAKPCLKIEALVDELINEYGSETRIAVLRG